MLWSKNHKDFVIWFFDWYILKRTHSSVFGQTAPPGFYFLSFLLLFFPWSLYVYKTLFKSYKFLINKIKFFKNKRQLFIKDKYLYEFSLFFSTYLVYEFLPSKLPSYILSFTPLIALWTTRYIHKIKISINKILFLILSMLILIHSFLILTKDKRKTSLEIGKILNQNCSEKVYVSKTLRLPGIFWYYLQSDSVEKIKLK